MTRCAQVGEPGTVMSLWCQSQDLMTADIPRPDPDRAEGALAQLAAEYDTA